MFDINALLFFLLCCSILIGFFVLCYFILKSKEKILRVTNKYDIDAMYQRNHIRKYYVETIDSKGKKASYLTDEQSWNEINVNNIIYAKLCEEQLEEFYVILN